MTTRAIVIRAAGDRKLAGAIMDGMSRSLIDSADYARMAVKEDRDREYWRRMIARAQDDYGDNPRHCALVRGIWGLIGLMCEKVLAPVEGRGE